MGAMNLVKALNQVQEESFTSKELHPYYGIRDSRGWLTRYPERDEDLNLFIYSPEWMREFISLGGTLDSNGVWGLNPYGEHTYKEGKTAYVHCGLTPQQAASFLSQSYDCRWDNLGLMPRGAYEVHSDCDYTTFKVLQRGQERKLCWKQRGLDLSDYSLLSLGWKKENWFWKKFAREFTFANEEMKEFVLEGMFYFDNLVLATKNVASKDMFKFIEDWERHTSKPQIEEEGSSRPTPNTIFGVMVLLKLPYYSNKTKYKLWLEHTSVGYVCITDKHIHLTDSKKRYRSGENKMLKSYRIRTVGAYKVCKIGNIVFVWEGDFSSHVEANTVRNGIETLVRKKTKSEEKKRAMKGFLTFRTWKEFTSSCLAGTKSFLQDEAPFLERLLKEFNSWEEVLDSDIADLEFQLTPSFMEGVLHRF